MDMAAIQALSDVHFREPASVSTTTEEVSVSRRDGASQPAAGGNPSADFAQLLDGLLRDRQGSAGADGSDAAPRVMRTTWLPRPRQRYGASRS